MHTIKTILITSLLILSVAKILHLDTVIKCNDILNPSLNNHHNDKAPDNSWSTTIANKENKTSDISSFSLNCHIKKNKTIKHERLVLTYLCSLLLANSYAPEPNPGPPKYPCGACNEASLGSIKLYAAMTVSSGTTYTAKV
jgi:hypothetical protein